MRYFATGVLALAVSAVWTQAEGADVIRDFEGTVSQSPSCAAGVSGATVQVYCSHGLQGWHLIASTTTLSDGSYCVSYYPPPQHPGSFKVKAFKFSMRGEASFASLSGTGCNGHVARYKADVCISESPQGPEH